MTEMPDIVIGARLLVQGKGNPPRDDAVLLVRRGRIVAIGRDAERQARGDAGRLDLGGLVLAPGLIDGHLHLVWSGAPGALYEAIGKSNEWLACRAVANMQKALAAGVTCVRDCGGIAGVVLAVAKAVREDLLCGPAVLACGAPLTTTGGHCWFLGLEAEGVPTVVTAIRRMHRDGADFIKVMVTGGGCTPGSNPRASQYSHEELSAMAEDAHRLGKRIAGHVHGTEGIERALAAGFDFLEHCSWLDRSADSIDFRPDIAQRMVERQVWVCRTIAGFERWPLEDLNEGHRAWGQFAALREMKKLGVRLFAGTDAGIDHTPFDGLHRTLETMVGLGGFTHPEAFASATSWAAEALGINADVGSLEVGKRADCIGVESDPSVDVRALRKMRAVLAGGRLVARDGVLKAS
jgi:imidazolonepropionase-like amidohydrolase